MPKVMKNNTYRIVMSASFIISVGACTSFYASGDFCRLVITFANSLDPDQDRLNVGPDLDPNRLTF